MARMSSINREETLLLDDVEGLREVRDALSRWLEAIPSKRTMELRVSVQDISFMGPHARITYVEYIDE